ncbi:hypothetical protein [Comamonas sp. JC664]|uniref:hypothetical protein n=1 Tax=Comamonas sp. JC664 TaxID=2801917 RepID=UPI00174B3964|nr:hypothetical protein [Comamonas sp. JC664]MBL0693478.1 hypothetical protein [Comamonas sp. JC664]GHG72741.1 hypothetical protein GCM10012319_18970 [Comamonas sp. KCTC 72670]
MPFTFRWTASGKRKQREDELRAWELLIAALNGTAMHAQVNGLAIRGPTGQLTGVNTASPHYARWRHAHKRMTRRARSDRQREQAAVAAGGPYHALHPALPCRVDPALNPRATLRLAALSTRTLENYGGGTMLMAGGMANVAPKATLPQLHRHLEQVLEAVEDELLDAARHREEHDLRAADQPPLQILLGTEWYFRIPHRPFSQVERDGIITDLEALSARYPEWLIVPGSIYWTPDPLGNARLRVFNEAPVLHGGTCITRHTKREQHDIDQTQQVRAVQRWGPDEPVAAPPYAIPPGIAATQGLCSFAFKGRTVCVEICRDQFVGDAVQGYLNAAQPGADLYLFLSNGTTLTPGFLPVVHQGIAVWCDGSGVGTHQYHRVTRANPLTHNGAGPGAPHPFTTYRNAFVPERDHGVLSNEALCEVWRIEEANTPDFQAFMTRFHQVFGAASTDLALKTAIDAGLGPLSANALVQPLHQKGLRIQQVLAGGALPTGTPIPPAEAAAVTAYAQALVAFATENDLAEATAATTQGHRTAAVNAFAVNTAALTPGVVAVANGPYDLHLHQLVDL